MTSTPIFADHHQAYVDAGWSGVLLLPGHAKHAPPPGYTGAGGRWPTRHDIERWAREHPDGNIALRLPRDVIGVDIDAYKGPGVRDALEAVTGPLPPTWCSTSRVDGSGIRFYRVPCPPTGTVWRGAPVPGVEIIQHHHRYAVVWPSIHPEGRGYLWVDETSGEIADRPPEIDELTELPWPAIAALTQQHDPGVARDPIALALPPGDMSVTVERRLQAATAATRGERGGRHDAACRDVTALVRLAERGEPGVERALALLKDAFCAAVAPDRPGAGEHAAREFDDIVTGAERLVAATEGHIPTRAERDAEWQRVRDITIVPAASAPGPLEVPCAPTADPVAPELAYFAGLHLLDWSTFWDRQHAGPDWLIEPLIARGRSHALYAGAKSGKSLLMLAACAAVATGRPFLNNPARAPQHVLYLDYEMTEEDVHERLEEFGYGRDDDLSHFHYALLPTIDPLDTATGAAVVVAAAEHFGAVHVVVDTMSRAVAGDENDADTVRAFYRYTGLHLKARGIGFHRLDHSGKDLTKGQRGTSAKNDDVDVVQQYVKRDGGLTLKATHRRMSWVPETVDITTTDGDGGLTFSTNATVYPTGTWHLVKALDDHAVPTDAGRPKVREFMKERGLEGRNDAVAAAIKIRRDRAFRLIPHGDSSGDRVILPAPGASSGAAGTATQNPRSDARDSTGDSRGQVPRPGGAVSVSIDTDSPRPLLDDDHNEPLPDDDPEGLL